MAESITISFANIKAKGLDTFGDTLTGEQLASLRGSNQIRDNNFYSIVGDGDERLELGETAYKLGDMGYGGRLKNVVANQDGTDLVTIEAHGRINNGNIGDLTERLRYRKDGLGLDNGPDGEGTARYLNSGDSLTFKTSSIMQSFLFTAQLRGDQGSTRILLDIDGNVITTADGSSAGRAKRSDELEDSLLAIENVSDGDRISIDFESRTVSVVSASTGETRIVSADAYFDAFAASDQKTFTIGSRAGAAVALDDVVIQLAAELPSTGPIASPDVVSYDSSVPQAYTFSIFADDENFNASTVPPSDVVIRFNVAGEEFTTTFGGTVNTVFGEIQILDDYDRIVFTPAQGVSGAFSFRYSIESASDAFPPTTATVEVRDTSNPAAPNAGIDVFVYNTSSPSTILDIFRNDDNLGDLSLNTYTLTIGTTTQEILFAGPAIQTDLGAFSLDQNGLTWTRDPSVNGDNVFSYTVQRGSFLPTTAAVRLQENIGNLTVPSAGEDSQTYNSSAPPQPTLIRIFDNDSNLGDLSALDFALSISTPGDTPIVLDGPPVDTVLGRFQLSLDGLTWTPLASTEGTQEIEYTANGTGIPPVAAKITLIDSFTPNAPAAGNDTANYNSSAAQQPTIAIPIFANDANLGDLAALSFTLSIAAPDDTPIVLGGDPEVTSLGTFQLTANGLDWTPSDSISGSKTVEYSIIGNGIDLAAQINLIDGFKPNAPVAENDTANYNSAAAQQPTILIPIFSNDKNLGDLALLSFALSITTPGDTPIVLGGLPVNTSLGMFQLTLDGLDWTPASDISGQKTLEYEISGSGIDVAAQITLSDSFKPNAPAAENDAASYDSSAQTQPTILIPIFDNDTNLGNLETLSFSLSINAPGDTAISLGGPEVLTALGTFLLTPNGLDWTPADDISGRKTLDYEISGNGIDVAAQIVLNDSFDPNAAVAVADTEEYNSNATTQPNILIPIFDNDANLGDLAALAFKLSIDAPGDTTILLDGAPQNTSIGAFQLTSDGLDWTPAADISGDKIIEYLVSGPSITDVAAKIRLVDIYDPTAPVAAADEANYDSSVDPQPILIPIFFNDVNLGDIAARTVSLNTDGNPTQVIFDGAPAVTNIGSFSLTAAGLSWTRAANVVGEQNFEYTVSGGGIDAASALVTLNDIFDPDAPLAIDDVEDYDSSLAQTFALNIFANDENFDAATIPINEVVLSFQFDNANPITAAVGDEFENDLGTFTVVDYQTVNFRAADGVAGAFNFGYTIDDGADGFRPTSATVSVVDLAGTAGTPIAVDDAVGYDSGSPRSVEFRIFDNDISIDSIALADTRLTLETDAGELTLTPGQIEEIVGLGIFELSADLQILSFTPEAGITGDFCFTYTLDDGVGGFAPTSATVHVIDTLASTRIAAQDDVIGYYSGPTDPLLDIFANDLNLTGAAPPAADALVTLDFVGGETFQTDLGQTVAVPGLGEFTFGSGYGPVTFLPESPATGNFQFTYTLSDGGGMPLTSANVSVVSLDGSTAPKAYDDVFQFGAGPLSVFANDQNVGLATLPNPTVTINTFNSPTQTIGLGETAATGIGTFTLAANLGGIIFSPVGPAPIGDVWFSYTIDDASDNNGPTTADVRLANTSNAVIDDIIVFNSQTDTAPLTLNVFDNDQSGIFDKTSLSSKIVLDVDGTLHDLFFVGPQTIATSIGGIGFDQNQNSLQLLSGNLFGGVTFKYAYSDGTTTTAFADVVVVDELQPSIPVARDDIAAYDSSSETSSVWTIFANDFGIDTTNFPTQSTVVQLDFGNSSVLVLDPGTEDVATGFGTFALDANYQSLTFTPTASFNGGDFEFAYTLLNAGSNAARQSVSANVSVRDVFSPSAVRAEDDIVAYDSSINIPTALRIFQNDANVNAQLPQGTRVFFTLSNGEEFDLSAGEDVQLDGFGEFSIDIAFSGLSFTPDPLKSGDFEIFYTIKGPGLSPTSATALVKDTNTASAPRAENDAVGYNSASGNPATFRIFENDANVDPGTLPNFLATPIEIVLEDGSRYTTGQSTPIGEFILVDYNSVSFFPDPDLSGDFGFRYIISDSSGATKPTGAFVEVTDSFDPNAPLSVYDSLSYNSFVASAQQLDILANDLNIVLGADTSLFLDFETETDIELGVGDNVSNALGAFGLSATQGLLFTPATNTSGEFRFGYSVYTDTISGDREFLSSSFADVFDSFDPNPPSAQDDVFVYDSSAPTATSLAIFDNDTFATITNPTYKLFVDGVEYAVLLDQTISNTALGDFTLRASGLDWSPAANLSDDQTFTYEVDGDNIAPSRATVTLEDIFDPDSPRAESDSLFYDSTDSSAQLLSIFSNDVLTNLTNRTFTLIVDGETFPDIADQATVSTTLGLFQLTADGLNWTPLASVSGPRSFDYQIDGDEIAPSNARVDLTDIAGLPRAEDDVIDYNSATLGPELTLDIFSNDVLVGLTNATYKLIIDGSEFAIAEGQTVVGTALGGFRLTADNLAWTPLPGLSDEQSFQYEIDGDEIAPDRATVILRDIATLPRAEDDVFDYDSSLLGAPKELPIFANDTLGNLVDPTYKIIIGGQEFVIANGQPVTGTALGDFELVASGLLWTPVPGLVDTLNFGYEVDGANIAPDVSLVTLRDTFDPNPPRVEDDEFRYDSSQNSTRQLTIFENDQLSNLTNLTYEIVVDGSPTEIAFGQTIAGTSLGDFTLSQTGLEWTPANGVSGLKTFGYRVNADEIARKSATVTLNDIFDANIGPVSDDVFTYDSRETRDWSLGIFANDTGVFVNPTYSLTVSGGTQDIRIGLPISNELGSFALSASGLSWTPAPDLSGQQSFVYTIDGESLPPAAATVTLIDLANQIVPRALPDIFDYDSTDLQPIELRIFANDLLLDTLNTPSYSLTVGGSTQVISAGNGISTALGAFDLTANGLVWTPTAGVSGDQTLTYTVGDASDPSVLPTTAAIVLDDIVDNPQIITTSIDENAPAGSVVAQFTSQIVNATFSILSGNEDGLLDVNGDSLVVFAPGGVDREVTSGFDLVVQATNGDETENISVVVVVNDLNDVAPVYTGPTQLTVDENSQISVALSATDGDATAPNNQIGVYNILSDPTGLFSIAGNVLSAPGLDFEATQNVVLMLSVSDSGVPGLNSDPVVLQIDVNDVLDTASVDENADVGTVIGQFSPTLPSSGFSIADGNIGDVFGINASNQLEVQRANLDRETVAEYVLTINEIDANSGILIQSLQVVVSVNDLNDNAPVYSGPTVLEVDENVSGEVTLTATDADATAPNNEIGFFTIVDDPTGLFTIIGESLVLPAFDFETTQSVTITVAATDNGTPPLESDEVDLQILVRDVLDTASVDENAPIGTVVTAFTPLSSDSSFAILAGNTNNVFDIDNFDGLLVVDGTDLDRETTAVYNLTIEETFNATGETRTFQLDVSVNDLNDNTPVYTGPVNFAIEENTTATVQLLADDDDATSPNNEISFALLNNPDGLFSIAGSTLGIAPLDFEVAQSYEISLLISDAGVPQNSSIQVITIEVSDVLETANVDENSAPGTFVATLTPIFSDSSFLITGGNIDNAFAINAGANELVVASTALDGDVTEVFNLTIEELDNQNGTSRTFPLEVIVNDLNDNAPEYTGPSLIEVDENAATSITLTASDTDQTAPNNQIDFFNIVSDPTGLFTLTGNELQVPALDFETTPTVAVTLEAVDGGTPPLASDQFDILINVRDLLDTADVDENSPAGTVVATFTPTSSDSDFAILGGNVNNVFGIDSGNQQLVVNIADLDREAIDDYTLLIEETDNVANVTRSFEIVVTVNDLNDNAPVFIGDTISETIDPSDSFVFLGSVLATDADADPANSQIQFNINDGFGIDFESLSIDRDTGDVSSSQPLAEDTYGLEIFASDGVFQSGYFLTFTVENPII